MNAPIAQLLMANPTQERRLHALQLAATLVAERKGRPGDLAHEVLDAAQRFDHWLNTTPDDEPDRAQLAEKARTELAEWEREHAEARAVIVGAERALITAAKAWRPHAASDYTVATDNLVRAVDALLAAETGAAAAADV